MAFISLLLALYFVPPQYHIVISIRSFSKGRTVLNGGITAINAGEDNSKLKEY